MDDFNSIVLEGHVVRDPVLKSTPKGTGVCNFPIAVNRFYRSNDGNRKEEVSFFEIESWGGLAESCGANCKKGADIRVVGRLKQNRWEDSTGKMQARIKIIAEHIDFKPRFTSKEKFNQKYAQQEIKDIVEAATAGRNALTTEASEPICEAEAIF